MKSTLLIVSVSQKAFTLAEVLITLAIIGVVAALTIPTVVKNYKEKQTVTQVKKFYRNFASIVQQWQIEEGCPSNVADCLSGYAAYNCNDAFAGIEKHLSVVKKLDVSTKTTDVNWLPTKSTNLNGTLQNNGAHGVSNFGSGGNCRFLLADGMTLNVHMPDSRKKSAYLFFDVNGKKEPNRIGKDVFPIGLGVQNYSKYPSVHPYFQEDSSAANGLCVMQSGNDCAATVDNCTSVSCSPTAYVLKNDKLPPITW